MNGSEASGSEEVDGVSGSAAGATFVGSFVAVLKRTVDPTDLVVVFLKGLLMGTADTVPGVSGGTIALVTGIYERLIGAITAVSPEDAWTAWRLYDPDGRARFLDLFERVDVPFLAALGLGIATAVVTVARVIEAVKAAFPAATFAVFFGLIAASAVVLYDEVDVGTPRRIALGVAGVLVAASLAFLAGGGGEGGGGLAVPLAFVFVGGMVAVCAMVLPGVSGAFLLILLGLYGGMLGVLNEFTSGLVDLATGGSVDAVAGPGVPVVVFLSGAAIGLLTVAHAIRWALEHYREGTLTVLVSLMVGGLVAPGRAVVGAIDPTPVGVGLVIFGVVLGAGSVLAFDHFTDDLDYA